MKLKDIKGFEGLYAITEDGRVWSYLRNKWLKPRIKSTGYFQITLIKDGKVKSFAIHRLVYETFKGQIPEGLTVDHIDGCKDNNNIFNLQLLTRGDNARKACKGKKLSEEHKRKLSIAARGINNPMYGKEPWIKGKKLSEETRRKMSEAHRIYWAKRKLNA